MRLEQKLGSRLLGLPRVGWNGSVGADDGKLDGGCGTDAEDAARRTSRDYKDGWNRDRCHDRDKAMVEEAAPLFDDGYNRLDIDRRDGSTFRSIAAAIPAAHRQNLELFCLPARASSITRSWT